MTTKRFIELIKEIGTENDDLLMDNLELRDDEVVIPENFTYHQDHADLVMTLSFRVPNWGITSR